MLYRGSAKVSGVVCVKKSSSAWFCVFRVFCVRPFPTPHGNMFLCQKIIFTQNTRNTQNFASHDLQSVRYIKLFYIQQKHHPAVISYFCLPLGNGNCPVNIDNSLFDGLLYSYKPPHRYSTEKNENFYV